jgi:parallel beta helix pectate lyase-like protein
VCANNRIRDNFIGVTNCTGCSNGLSPPCHRETRKPRRVETGDNPPNTRSVAAAYDYKSGRFVLARRLRGFSGEGMGESVRKELLRAVSWVVAPSLLMLINTACSSGHGLAPMPCVTRSDCDPSETCTLGECTRASVTPAQRDGGGGGAIFRRDVGPKTGEADAMDTPPPDAGISVSNPDAAGTEADSGAPADGGALSGDAQAAGDDATPDADATISDAGCANPIMVRGGLPYCTLAEAISAAPSGGTIDVPAGLYTESITIAKPLTLTAPAGQPMPVATIASPSSSPPLIIANANVTIEHFYLRANGGVGADVTGQAATLTDVVVTNARSTGINLVGSATLNSVVITGVLGDGIDMLSGSQITLTGSLVQDCTGYAIYSDGATVIIHSSNVLHNGTSGCNSNNVGSCWPGIYAFRGSAVTIDQGSKVDNNGLSGVIVEDGTSLSVQNAEISGNGQAYHNHDDWNPTDGVSLGGAGSVQIRQSTITNNYGYGIQCAQSNASCSSNTIRNNWQGSNCGGC